MLVVSLLALSLSHPFESPAPAASPAVAGVAQLSLSLTQDLDPHTRYEQAVEARDREALAALWRERPDSILGLFDSDLELSLSVWEESPDSPDRERIDALHQRALVAASLASEVTGRGIFADYASSFVGWTDEQKRSFRAGQQAFGAARDALRSGDAEAALGFSVECRERALSLGDWWGTAMGLSVEAGALLRLDRHEDALASASRGRLIYSQLGLVSSEFQCLISMVEACEALDRPRRALAALDAAIALLGEGDAGLLADLEQRREALVKGLGAR